MSVHRAIWDEWTSTRQNYHDVRRIRVTPHAIQGSPAAVPFAPDCVVLEGRPLYETHRWREILVHPEDWAELVADVERRHDLTFGVPQPRVVAEHAPEPAPATEYLFGIEVVR